MSACSTPEPVSDERVEAEETHPAGWFRPGVPSSSDSLSITGYSHSAAAAREQALQAGKETALSNLRYEIDRLAEQARVSLAEINGATPYSEAGFILTLRNRVAELDLSKADLEQIEERRSDGVTEVYTRVTADRARLLGRLASEFPDSRFPEMLLK